MAMQDSCSIISVFQALGLFPYRNLLVPQTLFSIVHTDREPGTDYNIIQDVTLFRNTPSYQVMTKEN